MKKLFVLIIKYLPIIQLINILVTNTIYFILGDNILSIILDYVFGVNIINTITLLICSYTFNFCKWHRALIFCNIINVSIGLIDEFISIPINNLQLLLLYYLIVSITLIIIIKLNLYNEKK